MRNMAGFNRVLPRVLLALSDRSHFINGKSGVTLRRELEEH